MLPGTVQKTRYEPNFPPWWQVLLSAILLSMTAVRCYSAEYWLLAVQLQNVVGNRHKLHLCIK